MATDKHLARYYDLKSRGICVYCAKSKATDHLLCHSCRLKQRAAQKRADQRKLESGRCLSCGRMAVPRRKHCAECARKHYQGQLLRIQRLRQSGRCVCCGKPGCGRYCSRCRASQNAYLRRYYRHLKSLGRCVTCRGEARPGRIHCAACAHNHADRARNDARMDVARGLCQLCRKPRGSTGTAWECRKCANKHSTREMARQRRRTEAGICLRCALPVVPGLRFCQTHRSTHIQTTGRIYHCSICHHPGHTRRSCPRTLPNAPSLPQDGR